MVLSRVTFWRRKGKFKACRDRLGIWRSDWQAPFRRWASDLMNGGLCVMTQESPEPTQQNRCCELLDVIPVRDNPDTCDTNAAPNLTSLRRVRAAA
jgi:hypothetical protein